jgi:ribonucleoside-diphosphate reductase beta chain
MSIFKKREISHLDANLFFDPNGGVDIARYETLKYKEFDHLYRKMRGFFWTADEVDLNTDRKDFSNLQPHEQHIFTSNLKRQILLDSIQGRGVNQALLPYASVPELEPLIETWGFFETIHSDSYTHIIRNVYPNPSAVFDGMMDVKQIVECSDDITKYYDDFIKYAKLWELFGEGNHEVRSSKRANEYTNENFTISEYELKKKFWLCVTAINILEGIRFYVSFACSWAFAENKKMEGNAKLIKLIARDENLHLSISQKLLRTALIQDDPTFSKIKKETEKECLKMYEVAMRQEKEWASYLFKDGSILGLNEKLLCDYVDWIGTQRIRAVGLKPRHESPTNNPLPWTESWIASKSRQVAPQESEIESYVIGKVNKDIDEDSFSDFEL